MAILCSCRVITTNHVKLAAQTCLGGCSSPCPMGRKRVKTHLANEMGAPNCGGCARPVNEAVDQAVEAFEYGAR